jgi:hypothetical protein
MHFRESGLSIRKEHQSKLAQDQVKVLIWEWQSLRWAWMPFNGQLIPLSRCARHANHIWIDIETDDDSLRSNAWSNASSDNTCPARYI